MSIPACSAARTSTDYCQPTGSSILYQLNYKSGFVLKTKDYAAQTVGNQQLLFGTSFGVGILLTHGDGSTTTEDQEDIPSVSGSAVRVSWREIE
jgi:hypothetical protein